MSITPERARHGSMVSDEPQGKPRVRFAPRHDEAVIQAEVRRLARALRPYGVLHREALECAAGAWRWQEGGFDRALGAAVQSGVIEPLPADFYRSAENGAARHGRKG